MRMFKTIRNIVFITALLSAVVAAQITEVTYQGQLQNSSMPAVGNYDFEFALFDSVSGGSQIGSTQTRNSVGVSNGIFSVNLDFSNLTNATAIGANALVTQDNSVVIGSINGTNGATATASVGINTTAPKTHLHIVGNLFIENNPNSLIIQSSNNSCFKITVTNAGVLSASAIACP